MICDLTLYSLLASINIFTLNKKHNLMKRNCLFFMVLAFALIACTTPKRITEPTNSEHASVKLAEAADAVSKSLLELARIQAEATPPAKGHRLPDPNSYGIKQVASVDWSGPIGPLVNKITQAISYRLRVLGQEPAVPIIITLSTKRAPVGDILRDVDFQAGKKAHVVVYPRTKVVELRYAKA